MEYTTAQLIGSSSKSFFWISDSEITFNSIVTSAFDGKCVTSEVLFRKENGDPSVTSFERVTGYAKSEVIGRHHRLFMPDGFNTLEYSNFWKELNKGNFKSSVFRRKCKNGGPVWLQASYNPIFDDRGRPVKVIKYATDISAEYLLRSKLGCKLQALDSLLLVAEFSLNGNFIESNSNYSNTFGSTQTPLSELISDASSYSRIAKSISSGESISEILKFKINSQIKWLQASINPVKNYDGIITSILLFATDVTEQHEKDLDIKGQMMSIDRSLGCVEFDLEGNVISANDNFLSIIKYSKEDVEGAPHRPFMPKNFNSREYAEFWADLNNGQFKRGTFKRQDKFGNTI